MINITPHCEVQQINNFLGQTMVKYYNRKRKGHIYH